MQTLVFCTKHLIETKFVKLQRNYKRFKQKDFFLLIVLGLGKMIWIWMSLYYGIIWKVVPSWSGTVVHGGHDILGFELRNKLFASGVSFMDIWSIINHIMTIDTLFIDGYFSELLENANKRVHLAEVLLINLSSWSTSTMCQISSHKCKQNAEYVLSVCSILLLYYVSNEINYANQLCHRCL